MEGVNRESRASIHFNMGYIMARAWSGNKSAAVDFQKALLENELDFAQINIQPNVFTLVRSEPSNLQIKLDSLGPQVSRVQVSSSNPQYDLDMFAKEAAAVFSAYQEVWQEQDIQILNSNAMIGHLYSCRDHGFKYLWERRLGQSSEDLRCFGGRPVAGGGLRLIMPPYSGQQGEQSSIEVRIGSFLREAKSLLVETVFSWPRPRLLHKGEQFDPRQRLEAVERYAAEEVWAFLVLKDNTGQQ